MLWDKFKDLSVYAPIYHNVMNEPDPPPSFVVLEDQTYDEPAAYGDGQVFLRKSIFNIRIHSLEHAKVMELCERYRNQLKEDKFAFTQFGPTFDTESHYHSILLTGSIYYGN